MSDFESNKTVFIILSSVIGGFLLGMIISNFVGATGESYEVLGDDVPPHQFAAFVLPGLHDTVVPGCVITDQYETDAGVRASSFNCGKYQYGLAKGINCLIHYTDTSTQEHGFIDCN